MKRKAVVGGSDGPVVEPSRESKVFAKLPRILEHLAVRKFDDGTPREAGKVFLGSDGSAFTVTLKEPSCHGQMTFRGATVDDALALADKWLGADDVPWELDTWSAERAAEKKVRKRK